MGEIVIKLDGNNFRTHYLNILCNFPRLLKDPNCLIKHKELTSQLAQQDLFAPFSFILHTWTSRSPHGYQC